MRNRNPCKPKGNVTTEFQYHGKSLGKQKAFSSYVFLILRGKQESIKSLKQGKSEFLYYRENTGECNGFPYDEFLKLFGVK